MALAARDELTSGCNSTEGETPHHETDRHRPSLDAVRCSRWRHLSSAHAAAAELCCRDLSHPGRLHRAQQPFSLLPLISVRRAWRWMQAAVPCNVPRITVASVLRANKSGIMLAKPKTLRD